ncbi:cleavage stimulation factor subunit 2 isoform X2 [Ambystoma mexicanum]|uniref:cleavage stimulation factor subunit 2 isoform X2 n=1 Tax=Ambystoma mexicanum TaxID=8296 RepID=UPI0037E86207
MMATMAARDPSVDRSLRSVFVGNIPYEATEEQLKDIFSEVGPVVSFRLVYDRETGKPKGYGFCEYQDQETALSAMRNLNGREFSGRALRVDNAASEKNKEELKSLGTGAPIIESPYGEPVNPEEAPESISRAVASLPPEQMFELMKQMKLCVQNSPQEARNMLLQNPQLAYALLQAQVVMRIVDPEIAVKILHRPTIVTPLNQQKPSGPGPNPQINPANPPGSQPPQMGGMHVNGAPPVMQTPQMQGGLQGPGSMPSSLSGPLPGAPGGGMQPPMGMSAGGPMSMDRVPVPMQDTRAPMQRGPTVSNVPPRGLLGDNPNEPRGPNMIKDEPNRGYMGPPLSGQPMHHVPSQDTRGPSIHDMRGGPMGEPRPMMGEPRPMMGEPRPMMGEPRPMMGEGRGPMMGEGRGPMMGEGRGPMMGEGRGPMMGEGRGPMMGEGRGPMMGEGRGPMMDRGLPPMDNRGGRDPRAMEPRGMDSRVPVPASRGPMPVSSMQGGAQGGFSPGQNQVSPQDHEKAALIMQVLQLTPDQIAMLPPEQRQSILILKEQIQKSTSAP